MQREPEGYRVSFRRLGLETIHTVMLADRPTTKVRVYARPGRGAPTSDRRRVWTTPCAPRSTKCCS